MTDRRWSSWDVADIRHAVERAGRPFAHLDGARIETPAELHAALAAELAFPAWYGANLDALADCLRSTRPDTVLLWDACGHFAGLEPRVFRVASDLLRERLTLVLRDDALTPPAA